MISSDVTDFDLEVASKSFSIDASGWQVSQSDADTYLRMTCDPSQPAPNACSSAAALACPMNCSSTCDASAHKCDLGLDVAVYQDVDLVMEHPELKSINGSLVHVTIDSVTYAVADDTLNVDTPMLSVYVAPMSVTDPGDPSATLIGTIAPVPAMSAAIAAAPMTFTDTGKQTLVATMGTFKNPFNIIVGATLMLHADQTVPTGKLDATVDIKAHASP